MCKGEVFAVAEGGAGNAEGAGERAERDFVEVKFVEQGVVGRVLFSGQIRTVRAHLIEIGANKLSRLKR